MSIHQLCVQIEFHHGNWSHLWQTLHQARNPHHGASGHGLLFYLHKHQIFLYLVRKFSSEKLFMPIMLVGLWLKLSCFCVSGVWKSPVEPSAFSYCEPQRGRDFYPSPKFNSAAKGNSFSFSGNNSLPAVSSNSAYWSNRGEAVTESFSPVVNKESGEKRQGTGNGCRLFGIQLLDNSNVEETSQVVMSRAVGDEQPVPYLDADSDQHSEPNRSDVPSVSCDAEKSCLRSPQESQSRQIRSCTKVFWLLCFFYFSSS